MTASERGDRDLRPPGEDGPTIVRDAVLCSAAAEAEGALTRASELALTFAQLVTRTEAFPHEAAEDLARLLGHSLAFETPAQRRHGNLGLLLDLIAEGTGEFVRTTRYLEYRAGARARGES